MKLIYKPSGPAAEYAPQACTIWMGCSHKCAYCYVPGVLRMTPNEFHESVRPRTNFLRQLRKEAPGAASGGHVLLSFASDPYPAGVSADYTRPAIGILRDAGCSTTVLTKRPTAALNDLAFYDPRLNSLGASITIPINQRWIEPNTDPHPSRIESLAKANAAGIPVWASLEPVLFPEFTLAILPTLDMCRFVRIGSLNHSRVIQGPSPSQLREFAMRAVDTCRRIGLPYYLKESIRKHLTQEDIHTLADMIPSGSVSLSLLNQ